MDKVEVDQGQRMADNIEVFMNVHKAELLEMWAVLEQDIDLIIMDMLMAGFDEIKTRAVQICEQEGGNYAEDVEKIKSIINKDGIE